MGWILTYMEGFNFKIFRAYDIRGIYPQELNEKTAEIIASAFLRFLKKEVKKRRLNLAISQDTRASSPSIAQAFKRRILAEGADLIDLGLSPTPVFYFGVWRYKLDGGVMITASHNPPQYNGLKLVKKDAEMISSNTGLKEIKKIVSQLTQSPYFQREKRGKLQKKKIIEEYLKFNFQDFDLEKMKNLKIVVDTGNGVAGVLIEKLKKYFPGKIYHLFPDLKPDFPNHLPNPLEEKNIKELKKKVKEKRADLGVAFDGDGDRIIFVDEKGKSVSPDLITSLLTKIILREKKRAKIIYNISSSNIIKEVARENGGEAIAWKIGHTLIKEKMKKSGAIFAGEYSGHYFLKSHHFCEAPLFVLFKILEEISQRKEFFSQILAEFKRYFLSPIVNFPVREKKKKLKELEEKFKKEGKVSHLDGLRVDFPDWWFIVRPSNTEELLRLNVEAKTKKLMEKKLKELKEFLLKK